ncbi:MAG TPA: UDP-2,4-diacetamido-2,4,6-trideoxy-beta-L-altropyranose hydrolase [Verrucomicrobiae bacterium]|nr:UDP-2,4-diacetamido-2,4,6-trideoxy-beta-L-altropyranose hydrolase [Verrucomicrobiae bacterium]
MNLLIRTDASIAIGTGHVMRCLALAQAWQDSGGRAVFALAESTPAVTAKLSSENLKVIPICCEVGSAEDARQTIAVADKLKTDWIAADGYRFKSGYQRTLKGDGRKLLVLDDYGHSDHYAADLVLNQNVSANQQLYANKELYTRLLLGPAYALLRREFLGWRDWKREIAPICRRVLIMMGGSDPENVTARVLEASLPFERVEKVVVVGGSNPHRVEPEGLAAQHKSIALLRDVADVPKLMAEADIAISAAGSTSWELCFMALPSLLIDVAENQTTVARELDRRGCAIHLGNQRVGSATISANLQRVCNSPELRKSMSECSQKLVDGLGTQRVIKELRRP